MYYKRKRENNKMYQRFNISESNLHEGMIVNGKVKNIKPYGAFIEIDNRNKWTFIHRRHERIKNKVAI